MNEQIEPEIEIESIKPDAEAERLDREHLERERKHLFCCDVDARFHALYAKDGGLPCKAGFIDDSNPLKWWNDHHQCLPENQVLAIIEGMEAAQEAWERKIELEKERASLEKERVLLKLHALGLTPEELRIAITIK